MSSNKFIITVLSPNGRRQNIPVTPNTTLLTVLEEVCKKQGFNPIDHDLKHHNHILDLSTTIRFSGLPNNAQLEICQAKQKRIESEVNIVLQLENGERISGIFPPSDNLWNIICKLCPNDANPNTFPVIIYMRQEIQGSEKLKTTILRSIGLTGGKALLRYIHRTPEQLKNQASVHKPLEQTKAKQPKLEEINKETDTIKSEEVNEELEKKRKSEVRSTQKNIQNDFTKKKEKNEEKILNLLKGTSKHSVSTIMSNINKHNNPNKKYNNSLKPELKNEDTREITFLDERNALIFDLNQMNAIPYEDLPDDFFELTIEDARTIYRDLQTKRTELENLPLLVGQQRELEESKRVLRQLNQYKRTILRIRFPDRTVLQGVFKPLETVNEVHKFVKKYINDSQSTFYLYTTPPKNILDPNKTLIDLKCVPSALLHFGINITDDQYIFLKPYLKEKFSTPSTAALAACRSRYDVPFPSTSKYNPEENKS